MNEKAKKHKLVSAIVAVSVAAAILLTGTYAWQSISQQALNEAQDMVNPGGRLHDDFDSRNKDVYVENFMTEAEGGVPIYARVRLDEYMELGAGAGLKTGDNGFDSKAATSLVGGANIDDVTTWKTHIPGDTIEGGTADDPFQTYWKWTTGGQTTYMPTFNKNKDSLAADINGTYEGTDPDDNVHYDDYHAYTPGEQKTDDAVYDNDDNTTDEGESAVNPDNITTKEETHTAASTLNATVMTMQAWIDAGAKPGPYWVYDVDGWAYWAQAIQPGTSTGLLLDGIQLVTEPDDNWYYGINVVGQFATMGNWGSAEGSDGFFGDNAGPAPTDNALFLLNQAAGLNTAISVTADGNATAVLQGGTLQFSAKVMVGGAAHLNQEVTWSVPGQTSGDTSISGTGLLTVGADEAAGTVLTITAALKDSSQKGSYTVTVKEPWNPELVKVTPGSNQTVSIDGLDWYVLAREGNKALVIPQYAQEEMAFDDTDNVWQGSDIQTYLNGTWLDSKPTLKGHAQATTFYTRKEFNSPDYIESTDKVFLLSEADAFGEHDHDPTQEPKDYTLGKPGIILPEDLRTGLKEGGGPAYYWLRSPSGAETYVASVLWGNEESYNYRCTEATDFRIRPVLWLDLVG